MDLKVMLQNQYIYLSINILHTYYPTKYTQYKDKNNITLDQLVTKFNGPVIDLLVFLAFSNRH